MSFTWKTVDRVGYLGSRRDEMFKYWDKTHNPGDWRLAWDISNGLADNLVVDYLGACVLYEDAYFSFFTENPSLFSMVVSEASNVYDDSESNVNSYLDYTKQETNRTHIQDIAIRRCLIRHAVWFRGDKFIQIRDKEGIHTLSMKLSPGRVPFHMTNIIKKPELTGWWDPGSVESFYQSNRVLQVKQFL